MGFLGNHALNVLGYHGNGSKQALLFAHDMRNYTSQQFNSSGKTPLIYHSEQWLLSAEAKHFYDLITFKMYSPLIMVRIKWVKRILS